MGERGGRGWGESFSEMSMPLSPQHGAGKEEKIGTGSQGDGEKKGLGGRDRNFFIFFFFITFFLFFPLAVQSRLP